MGLLQRREGYSVLDGNTVLAYAQQGSVPPNWSVWRAKLSYFIVQSVAGVLIFALGFGAIVYFLGDPNHAFVLGSYGSPDSGTLNQGAFNAWRIADFTGAGALALLGAILAIRRAAELPSAGEQMLVLLPEGIVMSTSQVPRTFAFAALRALNVSSYRGTYTLTLKPASGGKSVRIMLDGRFGKSKPIASAILGAHQRFLAAQGAWRPGR
jgi:hypothetical protein